MNKTVASKNNGKVKVKTKKIIMPIIASAFLLFIMISITFSNDLIPLMSNSVLNEYICNQGYKLENNECLLEINGQKLGDINNDEVIDGKDIETLQNYLTHKNDILGISIKASDVTRDGKIDSKDLNKLKFYLGGIAKIEGYVCPLNFEVFGNKCIKKEKAIVVSNTYNVGTAVYYNNSYWYILSNNDDYLKMLKVDVLDNKYVYNESDIGNILNEYATNISNDLKEVDGYKIRLLTLDELVGLGFSDLTNTNYYEGNNKTPYWIGINGFDYWVEQSIDSSINKPFMVMNYEDNSYAYEVNYSTYAYLRPVINVYKNAIK